MSEATKSSTPAKNRVNLSLDLRIVCLVLLVIIVGLLAVWKPWSATSASDRTIEVTGSAALKETPDEYTFYPSYQFVNADKTAALAEATKKSDAVTKALKDLGVEDSKIKSDTSGFSYGIYYPEPARKDTTYSMTMTVISSTKEQAQKIQDYLVTTAPSGAVSPQATFSQTKQKELESKARDEATKDARAKADQSGENLGFKVGKVKAVVDGTGFGDIYPMSRGATLDSSAVSMSTAQLAVQPGENEYNYSVTVTYYVR